MKNGSRPQEIQEAKAAVDSAQAEFDRAKRDWDRAQTLYKNDDISTAQYDQYRNRWENAEAMLKQTKERQALVLAGPRMNRSTLLPPRWSAPARALKMAESNALEIKRREQELPLRRSEIARAAANLAMIESQIADTVAYSPVDGVVLVKAADVGEVLAAGTTIVTIGDIDHPWLRAYINETDLGRVKLGTKAKITTDSYPGKEYRRPRQLHRLRSRVHPKTDPDPGRARKTRLSDQDRSAKSRTRTEVQHAGRRRPPLEVRGWNRSSRRTASLAALEILPPWII